MQLLETFEPGLHVVQFYGADYRTLSRNACRYIGGGLSSGGAVLMFATSQHSGAFIRHLDDSGLNPASAQRAGNLILFDAQDTLARMTVDGIPDWERFDTVVGALVRQILAGTARTGLRVYGDIAGMLWGAGQFAAAARLEEYWNKLLTSVPFSLFCSYPIDVFSEGFQIAAVDTLLCSHTHLLPAGTNGDLEHAVDRAIDSVLGRRARDIRPLIKANFRPAWAALPRAEAVILWLRNNLPDSSGEILALARSYYEESNPRQVVKEAVKR